MEPPGLRRIVSFLHELRISVTKLNLMSINFTEDLERQRLKINSLQEKIQFSSPSKYTRRILIICRSKARNFLKKIYFISQEVDTINLKIGRFRQESQDLVETVLVELEIIKAIQKASGSRLEAFKRRLEAKIEAIERKLDNFETKLDAIDDKIEKKLDAIDNKFDKLEEKLEAMHIRSERQIQKNHEELVDLIKHLAHGLPYRNLEHST